MRQIANANGYIIRTQDFEPYGSVLNGSGSGASVYGFTGEERDPSGLIILRARYMQPRLGIFVSRDPWDGDQLRPGSMNGYSYVEGNPINRVDPSGEAAIGPCMWPNHWEEVYDWSEGRRQLVEIRCVGPSGLPPVFGSTTTTSTGNPASDAVKILVIYGVYCVSQLLQQEIETQTKTWTWQDIYALPVADPFRAPLPTPEPLKDPFPLPLPRPTDEPNKIVTSYRGLDGDKSSDGAFFKRPLYSPGQFRLRPQDIDGLSTFELQYLPGNKPYAVGFDILAHGSAIPGSTGSVSGLPSCMATYTPQIAPGHWSLNCVPYDPDTLSRYAKSRGAILNPNWADLPSDRRLPAPGTN